MNILVLVKKIGMARKRTASVALISHIDLNPNKKKSQRSACDNEMLSLVTQMHEVINRNADGVNRIAIDIRRESDILLSLGISDSKAAKAGTYAQKALELANMGRGENLHSERSNLAPSARAELVAQAMMWVNKAEKLMDEAKKGNKKNINSAIEGQKKYLSELNQLNCQ